MKRLFILALALWLGSSAQGLAKSSTRVKGHTAKNGTYVPAHERTKANKSKSDNWSTKGNVNPRTGKKGTVDPNKTTRKRR
jgi:hypothetical protein